MDGSLHWLGDVFADGANVTCLHYFNEPLSLLGLVGSSGGGFWSSGVQGKSGKDPWTLPRILAAGDSKGRVHLMTSKGTSGLLFEVYNTGAGSPITSMASYSIRRNESVLVTGHGNGEV